MLHAERRPTSRRQQRDRERRRRAAEIARARGASAMAIAIAEIGAAFDDAAAINGFKMRVETQLRLGASDPAVRSRYRARGVMISGRELGAAIIMVEGWWRAERKAYQLASALGCATSLSLETLRELRLILRFLRFKRMRVEFGAALAELSERRSVVAAQ